MLLLDYNEERSLQISSKSDEAQELQFSLEIMNLDTAVEGLQGASAKVQINTLSPFVHFGGGIFSMTDVKKMTTKEDFFKLPLKERGCEADLYEDCRTASLVKECNCVPWELPGFQVGDTLKDLKIFFFRIWRNAVPKAETVLKSTPLKPSTAAQLVRGSMRMSSGKRIQS